MKNYISLILIVIVLSACNTDAGNGENLGVPTDVTFSSEINPTKTDWMLSTIYKDTLEFVSCDDSYDYMYAMFKTMDGRSVSLVCDELIDSKYTHGLFAIEWKIDSLSEAGESEEMYFDEKLLTYKLLEQPVYFGDYLTEFIKDYSNDSNEGMKKYLNEKVGFYTASKPDLYCVIEQKDSVETKAFIDLNCKILDEALVGNPCNGYPNIEDGMYFSEIKYSQVPHFESPVDEKMKEFTFPLNEDFHENRIKKVVFIVEETQYVQLYFLNYKGQWVLWAEEFCDCGA